MFLHVIDEGIAETAEKHDGKFSNEKIPDRRYCGLCLRSLPRDATGGHYC